MSSARCAVVAGLCLACSCSLSIPVASCWFTDHALLLGPATAVREAALTVTTDMGPVVVELAADVAGGSAVWSVTDPTGTLRWRCATGPVQHMQQRCEFPVLEGTWTVRREWNGFAGTQELSVTSASASMLRVEVRVAGS